MDRQLRNLLILIAWVLLMGFLMGWGVARGAEPYAFDPPGNPLPDAFKPYTAICHLEVGDIEGTGTMIATRGNKALVLSCRHVNQQVGNAVRVTWPLAGGQVTQGVVYEVIKGEGFDTDIALVICDRPAGVTPVTMAKFDPSDGPFVGAGWRDGQLRVAVSDTAMQMSDGLIWMESPFIGGQSGGCLFNRFGDLTAVIVASDRVAWGVSVDGPLLHETVSKYRRGQ